jgi:large subunit ribosomal protein L4
VLDTIELKEGKTRLMAEVCEKLAAGKKALFVLSGKNENVVRATQNLVEADACEVSLVNVYDLVRSGKVFITRDAVGALEKAQAGEAN